MPTFAKQAFATAAMFGVIFLVYSNFPAMFDKEEVKKKLQIGVKNPSKDSSENPSEDPWENHWKDVQSMANFLATTPLSVSDLTILLQRSKDRVQRLNGRLNERLKLQKRRYSSSNVQQIQLEQKLGKLHSISMMIDEELKLAKKKLDQQADAIKRTLQTPEDESFLPMLDKLL